jgi:hypothetical protein
VQEPNIHSSCCKLHMHVGRLQDLQELQLISKIAADSAKVQDGPAAILRLCCC